MAKAYIVSAVRTPIGKANKGSLVTERIDDLGALVVKEAVLRVEGLKPEDVDDVIIGCAMPEGEQGLNVARLIWLLAGFPVDVPAFTVNRFCASSLEAINIAASYIMSGFGDIFVVGGVESMSHVPMGGFNPSFNEKFFNPDFPQAYIPMGITAENIAKKYNITREAQDRFALKSHQKAIKAQKDGLFKKEIVPVTLSDGRIFDKDECPREDTSLEKLAELKPAFMADGTVTAGNSSPMNDGAAACVIMSESAVKKYGVKPLARIVAFAAAGVEPEFMGVGPVKAVPKALKRAGMSLSDIDIVELNEAFASQSIAVVDQLGIDESKLNPKGGAIAIGHPLGCTGARIMSTLIYDLIDFDKTVGLETMCIGGGQGLATIIERV